MMVKGSSLAFRFSLAVVLASLVWGLPCFGSAETADVQARPAPRRHASFVIPKALEPRVQFWLDIFTRFGRHQAVIHHREYPQATFAVLDFSDEAKELNPVALERVRNQKVSEAINRVVAIVRRLQAGERPVTDYERHVATAFKLVRGADKYGDVIRDPQLIRSQTGIREKCAEALERSGLYLHEIERIFVREFDLPIELTRLPFIESSFDYRAYSSVGAAGIWQLMPRTGRQYLTVSRLVDERRDPITATYAAARYLQTAYESLGSWPLAVTAYNHGNAGVARKVRDFGTNDIARLIEKPGDKPFGFASSNFFPEFLAALEVFDHPEIYFPEVKIAAPLEVTRIPLATAMPISQVARKLGTTVADLQSVNLALADAIWTGRYPVPRGYQVRVPRHAPISVARLSEPEIASPSPPSSEKVAYAGAYYKVRKGDSLSSIAKRYRTTVEKIKDLNSLSTSTVHVGQQLAVAETSSVPKESPKKVSPAPNRITYVVKSGDSLHAIAKRFGVSVGQIRELNRLSSTILIPGQKIQLEPRRR